MTGWQLDLGLEWYPYCATGGLPLGESGQPVGPRLLERRATPTSTFWFWPRNCTHGRHGSVVATDVQCPLHPGGSCTISERHPPQAGTRAVPATGHSLLHGSGAHGV